MNPRKTLNDMQEITFEIQSAPMGKVRQNRSDSWKKRPRVIAYRDFCDSLRTAYFAAAGNDWLPIVVKGKSTKYVKLRIPEHTKITVSVLAYYPQPKRWSRKKSKEMEHTDCFKKPDEDNLWGAVADALFDNDNRAKIGVVMRLWSANRNGLIRVRIEKE